MKKGLLILMALGLSCSLFACGEQVTDNEEVFSSEEVISDEDALTEEEQILFDCIMNIADKEIENPASLKVVEIGDYFKRTNFEPTESLYGPDTVIIRTTSDDGQKYFKICLTGATASNSLSKEIIENEKILIKYGKSDIAIAILQGKDTTYLQKSLNEKIAYLMNYTAEKGEYVELFSHTFIIDNDGGLDVGRINRAITKYWEDRGF